MLSISEGLIIDKTPKSFVNGLYDPFTTGTPSITNKGEFEPVIDPSPLILIEVGDPGVPDRDTTLNPATLPCRAASGDVIATPSI